jgi:hypothetical protein
VAARRKEEFAPCRVARLPGRELMAAAQTAVEENPVNRPNVMVASAGADFIEPARLAALTGKFWGPKPRTFGVSFVENTTAAMRDRILFYANKWSLYGNKVFAWSQSGGEIRLSRGRGGFWSFLGTDNLHVAAREQTMNLEGFTLKTPAAECDRVITHEFGHFLGFPHEHLRQGVIRRIDSAKAIVYFRRTQGWDEETTRSNVLSAVSESALIVTGPPDENSVMGYWLPGEIMVDGKPFPGGNGISELDKQFVATIYPKAEPPPPPAGASTLTVNLDTKTVFLPAGWKSQPAA